MSSSIILLHYNARPHTAAKTQEKIQDFYWELFNRPPYSPDLAPSDYFHFLHFKKFSVDKALKMTRNLRTPLKTGSTSGLLCRWDKKVGEAVQKCLEENGDYVEN